MNIDKEPFDLVYDVVLDEKGIRVDRYVSNIVKMNIKGKSESVRTFELLGQQYPQNLPDKIKKLKENKEFPSTHFFKDDFENIYPHNLVSMYKLPFLTNCRVLEKLYADIVINDTSYICTYVIYINMKNGNIFLMPMGIYSIYSAEDVEFLVNNGYKYITDSNLKINTTESLSLRKTKKLG